MRGYPEFNFPAFDAAAARMRAAGHSVFSPAERDRAEGFDPTGMTGREDLASVGFDLRRALFTDTAWICLHADAVFMLRGWENSSGARAERALAQALGLRVLYESHEAQDARTPDQVAAYMRGWDDAAAVSARQFVPRHVRPEPHR